MKVYPAIFAYAESLNLSEKMQGGIMEIYKIDHSPKHIDFVCPVGNKSSEFFLSKFPRP